MFVYFLSFLGGIALFLYGMQLMGDGLQKAAGAKLQRFLEVAAGNMIKGIGLGAVVTAILQASGATTVMTVGLVNAGLLNLKQAFGIIMGANIGTTITAQLIAFNIAQYVTVLVFAGFLIQLLAKRTTTKYIGLVLLGFGVLMMGMDMMSKSVMPLRTLPLFQEIIAKFSDYSLLGLVVGIVMTVIIQSSSAVVGILIAMASQGLLPLEGTIPVLLGSNIGTCFTAVLAALNANTTAKRVAMTHVMFNVIGSVLFLVALHPFTQLVMAISSDGNVARQIANAHAAFNIINTVLFIPFAGPFVKLVEKMVPQKGEIISMRPVYLDKNMLHTPAFAMGLARKEVVRMGELARENVRLGMECLVEFDPEKLKYVQEHEPLIDSLEKDITTYLTELSAENELSEELSFVQTGLLHSCTDIERIGDHGETLAKKGRHIFEDEVKFTDEAKQELLHLSQLVMDASGMALKALETDDKEWAVVAVQKCRVVKAYQKEMRKNHIVRLNEGRCNAINGFFMMELLINMKRVADHSKNIAQLVQGTF